MNKELLINSVIKSNKLFIGIYTKVIFVMFLFLGVVNNTMSQKLTVQKGTPENTPSRKKNSVFEPYEPTIDFLKNNPAFLLILLMIFHGKVCLV